MKDRKSSNLMSLSEVLQDESLTNSKKIFLNLKQCVTTLALVRQGIFKLTKKVKKAMRKKVDNASPVFWSFRYDRANRKIHLRRDSAPKKKSAVLNKASEFILSDWDEDYFHGILFFRVIANFVHRGEWKHFSDIEEDQIPKACSEYHELLYRYRRHSVPERLLFVPNRSVLLRERGIDIVVEEEK